LELVVKKEKKNKKIRVQVMPKLKRKPKRKLKNKLDNKLKPRKLIRKEDTKRRKGSKSKLSKRILKDNNAKLKSKRE